MSNKQEQTVQPQTQKTTAEQRKAAAEQQRREQDAKTKMDIEAKVREEMEAKYRADLEEQRKKNTLGVSTEKGTKDKTKIDEDETDASGGDDDDEGSSGGKGKTKKSGFVSRENMFSVNASEFAAKAYNASLNTGMVDEKKIKAILVQNIGSESTATYAIATLAFNGTANNPEDEDAIIMNIEGSEYSYAEIFKNKDKKLIVTPTRAYRAFIYEILQLAEKTDYDFLISHAKIRQYQHKDLSKDLTRMCFDGSGFAITRSDIPVGTRTLCAAAQIWRILNDFQKAKASNQNQIKIQAAIGYAKLKNLIRVAKIDDELMKKLVESFPAIEVTGADLDNIMKYYKNKGEKMGDWDKVIESLGEWNTQKDNFTPVRDRNAKKPTRATARTTADRAASLRKARASVDK